MELIANKNQGEGKRILFLDNLKVLLTVLVILHHVAITYGAGGSWYYLEHTQNAVLNKILSDFTSVNQSFFMSLFFLISGFFVPSSYDRKGAKSFLFDKFVRLGIPLLLFVFTISPILEYVHYIQVEKGDWTFWHYYWHLNFEQFNFCPGPMWFVETLFVFSILYALWRIVSKRKETNQPTMLTNAKIFLFIFVLTIVTFVSRIAFPIGVEYYHLQLGYFAHYICMFVVGIVAYRRNWMLNISGIIGKLWTILSPAMLVILGILVVPPLISRFSANNHFVDGGFHWESLIYSLQETFSCVGISVMLLYTFQRKCNSQKSGISKALANNAYTAYIMHGLVVVLMALSIRNIPLHPLAKFFLVSAGGVVASFFISGLIRKIPNVNKML